MTTLWRVGTCECELFVDANSEVSVAKSCSRHTTAEEALAENQAAAAEIAAENQARYADAVASIIAFGSATPEAKSIAWAPDAKGNIVYDLVGFSDEEKQLVADRLSPADVLVSEPVKEVLSEKEALSDG